MNLPCIAWYILVLWTLSVLFHEPWTLATNFEHATCIVWQGTWTSCLFNWPMSNEILLFSRIYKLWNSALEQTMNFEHSAFIADNELWISCYTAGQWTVKFCYTADYELWNSALKADIELWFLLYKQTMNFEFLLYSRLWTLNFCLIADYELWISAL